jgi:hypothetical protein
LRQSLAGGVGKIRRPRDPEFGIWNSRSAIPFRVHSSPALTSPKWRLMPGSDAQDQRMGNSLSATSADATWPRRLNSDIFLCPEKAAREFPHHSRHSRFSPSYPILRLPLKLRGSQSTEIEQLNFRLGSMIFPLQSARMSHSAGARPRPPPNASPEPPHGPNCGGSQRPTYAQTRCGWPRRGQSCQDRYSPVSRAVFQPGTSLCQGRDAQQRSR